MYYILTSSKRSQVHLNCHSLTKTTIILTISLNSPQGRCSPLLGLNYLGFRETNHSTWKHTPGRGAHWDCTHVKLAHHSSTFISSVLTLIKWQLTFHEKNTQEFQVRRKFHLMQQTLNAVKYFQIIYDWQRPQALKSPECKSSGLRKED